LSQQVGELDMEDGEHVLMSKKHRGQDVYIHNFTVSTTSDVISKLHHSDLSTLTMPD
jgi:hypothetical protein